MATGTIMPLPRFTGFDANGDPVSGGQLWTYVAGTSTPATVYSDVGLTIPHANPILLNSAGRPASGGSEIGVYLTPGSSYKFVLLSATGATIWTQDNVAATPSSSLAVDVIGTAGELMTVGNACYLSDGTGGRTPGFWYFTDSDIVYMSASPRQVGIATVNIAAGLQATIRISGAVSLPGGGFTPGATYYASGSPGQMSASVAQTYLRAIGVAQDVTTLIIGAGVGVQPVGITANTTLTGTQHNLAIPGGCSVLYCLGAGALTLTGIAAGTPGQSLTIVNSGGFQVDLLHQNAGSSPGNRFWNPTLTSPVSMATDGSGSVRYIYDGNASNWRLQQHEQSGWITPGYNAANFFANGGMTWTVDAGDVVTYKYRMQGRTVNLAFYFQTTSVGGTLSDSLQVNLPFVSNSTIYTPVFVQDAGGPLANAYARVLAGSAVLTFAKVPGANWSVATNTTHVYGTLTFDIQ